MRETFAVRGESSDTLNYLERIAQELQGSVAGTFSLRVERDRAIRQAQAAGSTIHELSKATGLSRAQVQRICDYSKDGEKR